MTRRSIDPLLGPVDPERFIAAWQKAQALMASSDKPLNIPPILMPNGFMLDLANNPAAKWFGGVLEVFPDPGEMMTCSMRFFGVIQLAGTGVLGHFFDPQKGIYNPALRVLAVAKCQARKGYDEADVKARLAKLDPPTD